MTKSRVWITSSAPGGTDWGTPINPPGATARTTTTPRRSPPWATIGVLWSNQENGSFQWMSRGDGDPVARWDAAQVVVQGANLANGYINFALSPTGDL